MSRRQNSGNGSVHKLEVRGVPQSPPPDTDPLLAIAVLQVVDVLVVPGHSDSQQGGGQEAILSQDHKVGEEAGERLDHTCGRRVGPCSSQSYSQEIF